MSPKKKIKSLYVEMDRAQSLYMNAASVIPAKIGVSICMSHDALAKDIKALHKTRWGHWKNRTTFDTARKRVEAHCERILETSRTCLNAAFLASAQERLAKEADEPRTSSAEPECRRTTREDSGRVQTSSAMETPPSRSSNLTGATSPTIPSNLSTASLPLQYPVMVPLHGAAQPSNLLSELEGLILDGNLIDFSDASPDLGQREGILIDFASEDSDASTIYRLSLGENDHSQMSNSLNGILAPPNIATETSAFSGQSGATGTPYSTNHPAQLSVPDVPPSTPSAGKSTGRFAGAAATVQMMSNVASAFSSIAGAIQNS
ncbi:uncharacterized protein ARMOST_11018 [Armillaria ostoyae]|uniref:Uncharacterized protein n=1 Tax=Armillaria ostoyae TaxID=47428 RepID=A0A284RG05_ARMOS|nr:uncharacterized protein ARMOST_11018 [Armillaria ostoyae]